MSAVPPVAPAAVRRLNLTGSGPFFGALLALAIVAFWPTYLSQLSGQTGYTHLHAASATLWLLLLIAQPMAIRAGRRDLHRMVGRLSYVVAPLVLASVVLLAHANMQGLAGERLAIQTYILYLQLSLGLVFAACYAMAIIKRHDSPVHMRFMLCTALTLIDPIVVRLMFMAQPLPTWNYQWFTFLLTDAVLVLLIWLDRNSPRGRWVFPVMLGVFVLIQIPALASLTSSGPWRAFAQWFAALGLG
ncbi:hypothetical protein G4Y73_10750 [Wenzhouxiangella sp. XN201]|uniref:hypothetical protein n=1 Tax=Wenzhouxiangella sp. XN201 TaxID=2710755 RepID=UPI0013C65882|nr:hypothetical protein [Wenzhouxiangella sp. XN201]NEZ04629.1 hypothetical protein [Wenzhouxiangella sp. XN201]